MSTPGLKKCPFCGHAVSQPCQKYRFSLPCDNNDKAWRFYKLLDRICFIFEQICFILAFYILPIILAFIEIYKVTL